MPNSKNPLPCFKCGKELEHSMPESSMDRDYPVNQPSDAVAFWTYGNYGSTYFDSLGSETMEIAICDDCLRTNEDKTRVMGPAVVRREPK